MSLVWVLVAAAAVLLLWPSTKPQPLHIPPISPVEPPKRREPSYVDAVVCLQTVRTRLVNTSKLEEAQAKALAALTLALSDGSEQ
jgi:hypothetical protein